MNLKSKLLKIAIAFLILFVFIYNSKTDYYNKDKEFFENNVHGVICNIKKTRGTKIYYNTTDFFYLSILKSKDIKIHDSIYKKQKSDLNLFRKDKDGKYFFLKKIEIKAPKDNYFEYFFDF